MITPFIIIFTTNALQRTGLICAPNNAPLEDILLRPRHLSRVPFRRYVLISDRTREQVNNGS